jgi:hypothetical protein
VTKNWQIASLQQFKIYFLETPSTSFRSLDAWLGQFPWSIQWCMSYPVTMKTFKWSASPQQDNSPPTKPLHPASQARFKLGPNHWFLKPNHTWYKLCHLCREIDCTFVGQIVNTMETNYQHQHNMNFHPYSAKINGAITIILYQQPLKYHKQNSMGIDAQGSQK